MERVEKGGAAPCGGCRRAALSEGRRGVVYVLGTQNLRWDIWAL